MNNILLPPQMFNYPGFTVPQDANMDVFIKKNIFIPLKSRFCGTHLTDGKFIKECELNKVESIKSTSKFNKTSIKKFFESVRVRDKLRINCMSI